MGATQDTEITLGTGRLLGLFFGLVVVCALFFGFGYTLGRGSAKQSGSLVAQEGTGAAVQAGTKPVAGAQPPAAKTPDCTATGADCSQAPTPATDGQAAQQDLSFYKSVEQKDAPKELDKPAEPAKAAEVKAPEMKGTASLSPSIGAGYMVQIAAVSKKEDAELLKSALQAKQYPVVVTNLPNDKLYHVQVGPFADMKDAEQMKTRLVGDGYNPILKK